jgi:hypothetical protein
MGPAHSFSSPSAPAAGPPFDHNSLLVSCSTTRSVVQLDRSRQLIQHYQPAWTAGKPQTIQDNPEKNASEKKPLDNTTIFFYECGLHKIDHRPMKTVLGFYRMRKRDFMSAVLARARRVGANLATVIAYGVGIAAPYKRSGVWDL